MEGFELWFMNILSSIIIIIGGWAMITYVFPLIENLVTPIIKDKKSIKALMGLLNIIILWIVVQGIIIYLLKIDNSILNLLDIFTPGLDIFLEFLPYLKWIIIGWFIVIALKKR